VSQEDFYAMELGWRSDKMFLYGTSGFDEGIP
jgi:hypothetical protein